MIQTMIKFVPPPLTRGRVNPFVGSNPEATPILIKVCNPNKRATP